MTIGITGRRYAARRHKTATEDTYHSMAVSRGASALGVALALGEIEDAPESAICRDWSLYSSVASTSGVAGTSSVSGLAGAGSAGGASMGGAGGGAVAQDLYNLEAERGLSVFDIRHRL